MMEFFSSYTGSDFLLFYGLLLIAALAASIWIPAVLRSEGKDRFSGTLEDAAMLSGGPDRFAQAVTTQVLAHGGIEPSANGKLIVSSQDAEVSDAGRSLLSKDGEFTLPDAKRTLEPHAAASRSGLTNDGLLMESGEAMKLRLFSAAPFLALLVLGLYRVMAGAAAGEPTGFLTVLLVLTVIGAAVRFLVHNPRTHSGNAVVKRLKAENQRMRTAPTPNEAGFAVGLFGTAVLVGTPFEQVHAMRSGDGGGGYAGDGGDSSDGGGSGCGGGGCGGCGG